MSHPDPTDTTTRSACQPECLLESKFPAPEETPIRILLMGINYAPETSGIAPYTSAVAAELVRAGHQVRVITSFPHYPEWQFRHGDPRWRRREMRDGVEVERVSHLLPVSTSGVSRLFSEISFGLRLATTRWKQPDLVVLVSPALISSAIALLRARLTVARPSVGIWVQDLYSLGMAETASGDRLGFATRLIRRIERATMNAADGLLVIHGQFQRVLKESWNVQVPIDVLRNWTHVESVDEARSTTREGFGWRTDEVIVLHTGNMGVKQGLQNVVNAARAADRAHAPIRFVLMGDGGERASLERAAHGVARIEFRPPLPEAEYMAALQAADVLLVNEHPGLRSMAVPSKLTSYFASARPVVVATHLDSITAREVESAEAGVRVEPADPQALLEATLALGHDPDQSARLGSAGRAYQMRTLNEGVATARFVSWAESLQARSGQTLLQRT